MYECLCCACRIFLPVGIFLFSFYQQIYLLHEIYVNNKVEHLRLRNAIYSTGRMCISVCKVLNEINDNLMK